MSIEVKIQALNTARNSIYSEVVAAFWYAITSGETSPFNTTIWEELPNLDHFIVTIFSQIYTYGGGSVHLVGVLRNDNNTSLNIFLVAGIYDQAKNVLDADTLSLALYALAPGGSLAYYFDSWLSLNDNQGLLGLADSYSVQWDPYWTRESSTNYIAITTRDDKLKYDDLLQEMIFTGQIVNNEDQAVSSAVVIIILQDKETGRLIATGSFPSFDSIPAGESME